MDPAPPPGGPLSWGERVRIKHMPTRCYLSVIQYDGGYKVRTSTLHVQYSKGGIVDFCTNHIFTPFGRGGGEEGGHKYNCMMP